MSFKRTKVLAALKREGISVLREGGAHTIVGRAGGVSTSLPRHRDLDRLTVRKIVDQLGLDWTQFQREIR